MNARIITVGVHMEPKNQNQNQNDLRRILVVEDDPAMKALLQKAVQLARPQSEMCFASSLEEAFAKILQFSDISEKQPCELIIADIFLEGNGTGLDLWRVLCGTYPKIPFLVISSLPEDEVARAVAEKASPEEKEKFIYLKKPFTVQSCAYKIRSVLKETLPEMSEEAGAAGEAAVKPAASLMGSEEKQHQMAHLLMLKLSADWLSRQAWLDEPYGGQNPAQELLFHTRVSANRLWEDFFVAKDNRLTLDREKLREHIQQMSELTPELKEFLAERLSQMETVFHSH